MVCQIYEYCKIFNILDVSGVKATCVLIFSKKYNTHGLMRENWDIPVKSGNKLRVTNNQPKNQENSLATTKTIWVDLWCLEVWIMANPVKFSSNPVKFHIIPFKCITDQIVYRTHSMKCGSNPHLGIFTKSATRPIQSRGVTMSVCVSVSMFVPKLIKVDYA